MWCRQKAILTETKLNRKASLLAWLLNPRYRFTTPIFGDVLITGHEDDMTTAIPQTMLEFLFFHNKYKAEYKLLNQEDWVGNQARYTSWVEATNAALLKCQQWSLVEDIRVLPAAPLPAH